MTILQLMNVWAYQINLQIEQVKMI